MSPSANEKAATAMPGLAETILALAATGGRIDLVGGCPAGYAG